MKKRKKERKKEHRMKSVDVFRRKKERKKEMGECEWESGQMERIF